MSKRALAEIIAAWQQLLAGADANRDDLPALEDVRSQLAVELAATQATHARKLALNTEAHQATLDLRTAVDKGWELAERFRSGVRLLYGKNSSKLAEFGMKLPRRPRSKPGCKTKGCPPGTHHHR
jgi:hypothetical protein